MSMLVYTAAFPLIIRNLRGRYGVGWNGDMTNLLQQASVSDAMMDAVNIVNHIE